MRMRHSVSVYAYGFRMKDSAYITVSWICIIYARNSHYRDDIKGRVWIDYNYIVIYNKKRYKSLVRY